MFKAFRFGLVLAAVPIVLTSCTSRTILHGNSGRPNLNLTGKKVSVWFVDTKQGNLRMVPVQRAAASADKLKEAVESLLAGPTNSESQRGLGSEIPRGTVLIGLRRNGNAVELNLSRRFATGGGTMSFETRMQQLVKTATAADTSGDIYLNIEGQRMTISPGEGIEIPQPINR